MKKRNTYTLIILFVLFQSAYVYSDEFTLSAKFGPIKKIIYKFSYKMNIENNTIFQITKESIFVLKHNIFFSYILNPTKFLKNYLKQNCLSHLPNPTRSHDADAL